LLIAVVCRDCASRLFKSNIRRTRRTRRRATLRETKSAVGMLNSLRLHEWTQTQRQTNIAAFATAGVVILVSLFASLGAIGLAGPDEPRYAWIARAMAETGDWVTPRLWGAPWFEKPILYYWAAAIGFRMHLPAEWAARLPSAIAALAAAKAIAWFARQHYSADEDSLASPTLLAPVIFATSVAAIAFARAATPDMLFSAAITLAMVFAANVLGRSGALPTRTAARTELQNHSLPMLLLWGASLGLGVLAKGPAAVILAGGAIGIWALATSSWRPAIRLAHPVAIAAFCAVALPWYVLCARRNPDFLHVFIFQHNFERYLTPLFQHQQPFWFFGPITILALLPWSAFLIAAVQEALRLWREKSWKNSPGFFVACWALFPIVFFSFSQSKLPSYILPAVPALALITAISASRAFQRSRVNAIILSAGIGLVWILLAAIFLHATHNLPFTEMPSAIPFLAKAALAIAIVFAAAILYAGINWDLRLVIILSSLCAVATLEGANTIILPALDLYVSARPHAAFFQNDLHPDRIFTYQLRRSWNYGLAFYFHREIPEWSPQDPDAALVLTSREGLEKIQKAGRFQGTLEAPQQGILYVPVAPAPRY
jgi:4-amino-4-deoxy-L-arabinose transferase-like glycosyltransferase